MTTTEHRQNDLFVPPVVKGVAKSPLEKDVEAKLIRRVRAAGGISWKFVSPNNRGVSDRVVLIDGRVIFVELKRDGGKMTPLQQVFREKVESNGGEFALVVGMDGVEGFIAKIKAEQPMWRTFYRAIWSMIGKFSGKTSP